MPSYKLIYFNARGRAELSRLILAAVGQEYEDYRFERDDWPKYKDDTPYGLTPVLEVDGIKLSQSKTIARFLANKFDLAGKSDLEKAQADAIVELLHDDLLGKLIPLFKEEDENKKADLRKQFEETFWPNLLTNLSKQITGDYMVGNSLTWADIAVMDALSWVDFLGVDLGLDKHPKLDALVKGVKEIPSISDWMKKRPITVR